MDYDPIDSFGLKYCSDKCRKLVGQRKAKALYLKKREIYSDTVGNKHLIINEIYKRYKSSSADRGHTFELLIDDFEAYYKMPCYYCGDLVHTVGIDRIDNEKGYIKDNVVSCCPTCNIMKHTKTQHDFIAQCIRIANNHT